MARTRGASNVIHVDDGELVDIAEKVEVASEAPTEPVAEPVPARFRCDVSTIGRDADGWEVFRLVDVLLGGLASEVDGEAFARLPADVRRHFKRIA